MRVFIDGGQGTTGLRLGERLSSRADVTLLSLPEECRKDERARLEMLKSADAAFFCLPDDASKRMAALAGDADTLMIDASTAHRVNPAWAYGFPELSEAYRENIQKSSRIAVPGCHASGFAALCYPLVSYGIIGADYPVCAHSLTGYTGGGKKMIAQYEAQDRDASLSAPRPYALSQAHKHLPEMQAVCGLSAPPAFCPIVDDFACGMAVTLPLDRRYMKKACSVQALHALFCAHYAGQTMVRVRPFAQDVPPVSANALAGSDAMDIIITGSDEHPLLMALFDNLGKGASGAAIQCMNIHMGLAETTGLTV